MSNTITVYDNGGETLDRYTIFIDDNTNECIAACTTGAGFYQHTTGERGEHLGELVSFDSLAKSLKARVMQEVQS